MCSYTTTQRPSPPSPAQRYPGSTHRAAHNHELGRIGDVADVAGVHLRRGAEVAFDEVQGLVLVGPGGTVVVRQRRWQRPSKPAVRMSRATRRRPQAIPWWASSACTRGEP